MQKITMSSMMKNVEVKDSTIQGRGKEIVIKTPINQMVSELILEIKPYVNDVKYSSIFVDDNSLYNKTYNLTSRNYDFDSALRYALDDNRKDHVYAQVGLRKVKINTEVRLSLIMMAIKDNMYDYGTLSYVISALMRYRKELHLTDEKVINYSLVLCMKCFMERTAYYSLSEYGTKEHPIAYRFISYIIDKLGKVEDTDGLKYVLLKKAIFDLIKEDNKLFRAFWKELKNVYFGYYLPEEILNQEGFMEYLKDSIEYALEKNRAKKDLISFLSVVIVQTHDKTLIETFLNKLTEAEKKSALKSNPKLLAEKEIAENLNGFKADTQKIERGSSEYYTYLNTAYKSVNDSRTKISTLDQLNIINKQKLSQFQLFTIEKILGVTRYGSETIMKNTNSYGKLISTEPRVYNNLATLLNSLTDEQYESCRTFIDMIINKFIATSPFFAEAPMAMMTTCMNDRFAEDLLFIIENKKLNKVRESFIEYLTESNGTFLWALEEYMGLTETMLMNKKKYPKLTLMYLKKAI